VSVTADRHVVRIAGQIVCEHVPFPGACAVEPQPGDPGRAGLGHQHKRLVRRQHDTVGELKATAQHVDRSIRIAAHQPSGAGMLDEVGPPPIDREALTGR